MNDTEAIARVICKHSLSGFCQNVGGTLGCKVGRGVSASEGECVATYDQLLMAGNIETAEAVLGQLKAEGWGGTR